MCTEEEKQLPTEELSRITIKHVCEAFEENYKEQVKSLTDTL